MSFYSLCRMELNRGRCGNISFSITIFCTQCAPPVEFITVRWTLCKFRRKPSDEYKFHVSSACSWTQFYFRRTECERNMHGYDFPEDFPEGLGHHEKIVLNSRNLEVHTCLLKYFFTEKTSLKLRTFLLQLLHNQVWPCNCFLELKCSSFIFLFQW